MVDVALQNDVESEFWEYEPEEEALDLARWRTDWDPPLDYDDGENPWAGITEESEISDP